MEVKYVEVHNPFDRTDRDIWRIETPPETTLAVFAAKHGPQPPDSEETRIAWSVNGHIVDLATNEAETIILRDGDCLVCVPCVCGGDSKNPLAIIAGLVLAIVAPWAGIKAAGWLGLTAGTTAYMAVSGLVAGGIMMLGGQLISNLFYSDTSGLGVSESERKTSYNWGSQQNAVGQGGALAQTYGTIRTAGTLIGQHVRNVVKGDGSSDSYLDLLYCGGEGLVDFLGNVEINGTPLSSYTDASVQYRYGDNTQAALNNFGEIIIDQFPGINLATPSSAYDVAIGQTVTSSYTYSIALSACTMAAIVLRFPGKLRYQWTSSNGDHDRTHYAASWSHVKVEYRLSSDAAWSVLCDKKIHTSDLVRDDAWYAQNDYEVKMQYNAGTITATASGTYQIRVTKLEKERFSTADTLIFRCINITPPPASWAEYVTAGDSGSIVEATVNFPSGLYHVSDAGEPESSWVRVVGQIRAQGDPTWHLWVLQDVWANLQESFSRTWRINIGAAGRYFVRFGLSAAGGTTTRYVNACNFSQLSHIIPQTLTRPGKVLVALSIKATDQLSGSMPTITWEQRRNNIYVKDGGAWVQKSAQNPAWICYDMVVQAKNIDGQILVFGDDPSRIDLTAFKGWAAWNDRALNNRAAIRLNLLTDEIAELWDWFSKIGASGRGAVMLKGTKISCVWDQPSNPVQCFGMGNIVKDSFSGEYLGTGDRANAVEVSFIDAAKKYERRQITCYSDSYNTTDKIPNANSVFLVGVTDYSAAYREGMYRLRQNEHIYRTVSLRASVDALACQAGDVVGVAHDVPQWGQSGRLDPNGTTTTVLKLLEPVAIEAGKDYLIAIQIATNAYTGMAERGVAKHAETTTTKELTLTSALPCVPQPYANWQFGLNGKIVKPFRVKSIERSSDLEVTLSCVEYIAEIYTESDNIPDADYSTGYDIIATDVRLREDGYRDNTGKHIIVLGGTWKWTQQRPMKFDVEYQINGGQWIGHSSQLAAAYSIPEPQALTSYRLRVRPYDSLGIARAWAYSEPVTVRGDVDSMPPDITGLVAAQSGEKIILTGKYANIPDLKYIEVRRDGSAWENAMVVGRYAAFPAEFLASLINDGSHIIRAKLVDNNGQYSQNDAVYIIAITGINRNKNIVLERNDCTLHNGTLTNLKWSGDNIYGGGATYAELYGENGVYNDTDEYLDAENLVSVYLSPVVDTYKVGLTGVMLDFNWSVYMHDDVTYKDISDYQYSDLGDISTYDALKVRGKTLTEIRFSDDNTTWSEWQEYLPGQYVFRYCQYRQTYKRYLTNSVVKVTSLNQVYDVPDLDISDTVTVPAAGLTINFATDYDCDFYAVPAEYSVFPKSNGVYADIVISATAMIIKCYTANGTAVAATCRVIVHGY